MKQERLSINKIRKMTNLEKLNGIFCEVFSVGEEVLDDNFKKENVEGWDSVRQLSLTTMVEDEFDIMLDTEDIIGFCSYKNAKEILKKYGLEI